MYTVKKVGDIPFPAGMSFTKLSLGGNNLKVIIPAQREFVVSDNPAGDGNVANLFYSVEAFANVIRIRKL
jgi:hypothetical protein